MPVLIGVFYTVRTGLLWRSRSTSSILYQHIDWTFGTTFLGLNLLESNAYLFAPLLVIMQFIQMKLTFAAAKKKREQSGKPASTGDASQQLQQKMMLYGLPLMIGVFAFQFPAAVSLYWGVSTLFAIGQQMVVNREKIMRARETNLRFFSRGLSFSSGVLHPALLLRKSAGFAAVFLLRLAFFCHHGWPRYATVISLQR